MKDERNLVNAMAHLGSKLDMVEDALRENSVVKTMPDSGITHLAGSLGELADAMREQTAMKGLPPVVTVSVPEGRTEQIPPMVEVTVPVPNVNVTVPVPIVNIQSNPENVVNVSVPAAAPVAYVCRVTQRDAQGFIQEFQITPVG